MFLFSSIQPEFELFEIFIYLNLNYEIIILLIIIYLTDYLNILYYQF